MAALTGLSARQLQLWDESGLLPSAIRPRRTTKGGFTERRYTPIELFELLVLGDLRHRGFSVHQLHAIVDALRTHFSARLFDATGGGADIQLLTDGVEVYARTAGGEFFNLLRAPAQPLLVVGEQELLRELKGKARERKTSKSARAKPREAPKA